MRYRRSDRLEDALLLGRLVVAVLANEERAAIPAIGAWARIVIWIAPGFLVLKALFAGSSAVAWVRILAGTVLPIRSRSKRPRLYRRVFHVAAAT